MFLALAAVAVAAALGRAAPSLPSSAATASDRCPLGDLAAQDLAYVAWAFRTLAEVRRAAEGGDLSAQLMLGECYEVGDRGARRDASQAVVWYRRAAAGNMAMAQLKLGNMLHHGDGGLAVDFGEAARLFALSAAQGVVDAQFNLGLCFLRGEGVPRSPRWRPPVIFVSVPSAAVLWRSQTLPAST